MEATVSIKVCTVGEKKMTQSMFRQLPELHIFDYALWRLRGDPWGWVNYKCGRDTTTFNFVEDRNVVAFGKYEDVWSLIWEGRGLLYRCNANLGAMNSARQKAANNKMDMRMLNVIDILERSPQLFIAV